VKDNQKEWGGRREGAGRHQKYGEPTEVLKFSVPVSKKAEFLKIAHDTLSKWEVKKDGV
jgi:hypothetical protein